MCVSALHALPAGQIRACPCPREIRNCSVCHRVLRDHLAAFGQFVLPGIKHAQHHKTETAAIPRHPVQELATCSCSVAWLWPWL